MEINLKDLIDKIENQEYIQDLETVKYADVSKSKKKLKVYTDKMVKEVVAALKHDSLVQTQLALTGRRPVTFALETNIINLPYSNYKKISNFFDEGVDYALNVYFETRSEYINVSHFRIDQIATEKQIEADPEAISNMMVDAIMDKLQVIREYKKPEKITAKKTTTKKTTTKKKATKKSK